MRILICAAEPPVAPLNGFRLQLDQLGTGLAGDHELTVLAPRPDSGSAEELHWGELLTVPVAGPIHAARATVSALFGRGPRAVARVTPAMTAALDRLLSERQFDVAQVSGPSLAALAPVLEPIPAVLSALDAWHLNVAADANIGPLPRRLLYRREELNVRRFSADAFGRFQRVVVVSDQDAEALADLDANLRLDVVPNGVDVEVLRPKPAVPRERGLVVFTGAMHWAPNSEAALFLAEEILPSLRARRPEARLAIVGRNPRPEVQALAAMDGVEVTGEVPDIREWLWKAEAYVCPMVSGTGIKNKLLEALACGVPAVATPLACQGISAAPERDVLVAESADDLAEALARVLDDVTLRNRLSTSGRRAVVAHHGWDAVVRAYERIYEAAIAAAT